MPSASSLTLRTSSSLRRSTAACSRAASPSMCAQSTSASRCSRSTARARSSAAAASAASMAPEAANTSWHEIRAAPLRSATVLKVWSWCFSESLQCTQMGTAQTMQKENIFSPS